MLSTKAALRLKPLLNPPTTHAFSTTPIPQTKTLRVTSLPASFPPPYPYGPRPYYHQSNKGLYAQSRIRFGNTVAERYGNRSRRTWRPNVFSRRLWSPSLSAYVRVRVTARVLRTMEKNGKNGGNFDDYLVGGKAQRIKDLGPAGWKLRWLVMQTPAMRARFAAERESLGLTSEEPAEEDERRARELLVLATDYMTPGPLSRRSRDILAARAALVQESFEGEGEMEVEGLEFAEAEDAVEGESEAVLLETQTKA